MGYLTRYTLEVAPKGENFEEIKTSIISENYEMTAWDLIDGNVDDCKWYDHDDEMKAFSKKFPKALFTLNGEGEESGDVWRAYYQNGKSVKYHAEISFPGFDSKKLK